MQGMGGEYRNVAHVSSKIAPERARRRVGLFPNSYDFISSWRSIFDRLEEHGYEPEITYFARKEIQESCPSESLFKTSGLLTDKGQVSTRNITMTWC